MNTNALAALTGMPSGKKTHRGRRSRGKGSSPSTQTHLDSINASMKSDDHGSAMKSGLALVNALHKAQKKAAATNKLRPPGALESEGGKKFPSGLQDQASYGE